MPEQDLTRAEVQKIARTAAHEAARESSLDREEVRIIVAEAVRQTLTQLGIQSEEPLEMQRDFQHLRQWRRAGEELRSKSMLALTGLFITGVISAMLLGIREWFR